MTATPKRRCVELYISTRVATFTDRDGVGFYIIITIIARWFCTSIHHIILSSL